MTDKPLVPLSDEEIEGLERDYQGYPLGTMMRLVADLKRLKRAREALKEIGCHPPHPGISPQENYYDLQQIAKKGLGEGR